MPADYPEKLHELVAMFDGLPRQDRIDLLLEFAESLPEVPEHLKQDETSQHAVHECLTPVWVYVEPVDESVAIYVEVGEPAPTIRAVASILIEGCEGAPREQILAIPADLPVKIIGPEMVGQRRLGLGALVKHVQRVVAELG